jgi:cation:H+ antiporter
LAWAVIAIDPFNITSSIILLIALIAVISFWYKSNQEIPDLQDEDNSKNSLIKLILSLMVLVFAAWLITKGANLILDNYNLGQLFIGYTVLAIGTSLPEIAASVSLALKRRYEAVAGTLIGSNIFNGLCVLAIPGLFRSNQMAKGWDYSEWSGLLVILFTITLLFCTYIFILSKQAKRASILLSILFLSVYFISLIYAY